MRNKIFSLVSSFGRPSLLQKQKFISTATAVSIRHSSQSKILNIITKTSEKKVPLHCNYRLHHCNSNEQQLKMLPRIAFSTDFFFRQTILNPKCSANVPKFSVHNDTIESNISNSSANCSTTGRRRKGSSLGGTLTTRSARIEAKELRSALQDREAVIQNLRIQLCLGKLPRPTGPPLDESEKPAAEQKLSRLKTEAENKRIKIKNLKSALEKLDITDNIDVRIRQAELEYALGREELQMLSIVEEARALQARLEKSKPESQSLYNILNSGAVLSLHAVHATTGRWAATTKTEQPGIYVEWALEGDGLYKGDRILEINGKLVTCKTKEDLQKQIGNTGKCQMVVLRKKSISLPQKQLDLEKENNLRLQHRISYLEEQVKELQTVKEQQQQTQQHVKPSTTNGHVTSISITSPETTHTTEKSNEKPLVFQRGNYITTLVGGKPIELMGDENEQLDKLAKSTSTAHITKTLIKENTNIDLHVPRSSFNYTNMPKSLSSSKISINSDSAYAQQHYRREKDRQRERYERAANKANTLQRERSCIQAHSVEHLNQYNGLDRRDRRESLQSQTLRPRVPSDMRSVKSLDFDSDTESKPSTSNSDAMSEARSQIKRPTPPKKPLRLSLQRAQSLQTVELNAADLDRKRATKRAHIHNKSGISGLGDNSGSILIENCTPLHTASLGRHKHL